MKVIEAPRDETPAEREKRCKTGGRKRGSRNKRTLERLHEAERQLIEARRTRRRGALAVDYMDDMIVWFSKLVTLLAPFNADGTPVPDRDPKLWFRAVECFQGFLAMRAPYETPRLNAVQMIQPPTQSRTTVNVTLLDERGELVFRDEEAEDVDVTDAPIIEHDPNEKAA